MNCVNHGCYVVWLFDSYPPPFPLYTPLSLSFRMTRSDYVYVHGCHVDHTQQLNKKNAHLVFLTSLLHLNGQSHTRAPTLDRHFFSQMLRPLLCLFAELANKRLVIQHTHDQTFVVVVADAFRQRYSIN